MMKYNKKIKREDNRYTYQLSWIEGNEDPNPCLLSEADGCILFLLALHCPPWLEHLSIYGLGSGGHGRLVILNPIPSSFLLQLELEWIVAALLGTPLISWQCTSFPWLSAS